MLECLPPQIPDMFFLNDHLAVSTMNVMGPDLVPVPNERKVCWEISARDGLTELQDIVTGSALEGSPLAEADGRFSDNIHHQAGFVRLPVPVGVCLTQRDLWQVAHKSNEIAAGQR